MLAGIQQMRHGICQWELNSERSTSYYSSLSIPGGIVSQPCASFSVRQTAGEPWSHGSAGVAWDLVFPQLFLHLATCCLLEMFQTRRNSWSSAWFCRRNMPDFIPIHQASCLTILLGRLLKLTSLSVDTHLPRYPLSPSSQFFLGFQFFTQVTKLISAQSSKYI